MRSQSYNTESRDQGRPSTTQVQTVDAKTIFPVRPKITFQFETSWENVENEISFLF